MARSMMLGCMLLSGCSLLVPSPGDFTADLVDSGQDERDAGVDAGRDSGVEPETDAGPACAPGLTECAGGCVDTHSDLAHCGGCENACAATDVCREGACFDPVVQVAAAAEHTCVLRASGQVWCWGSNIRGQLGDGRVIDSPVPVRVVDLEDAAEISASGFTFSDAEGGSCARSPDGTVRCWGTNTSGELGDGTTEHRSRPVIVQGLPAASHIAGGYGRSCAVTTDDRLFCWGADGAGGSMAPTEMVAGGISGAWVQEMDAEGVGACVIPTTGSGAVYCHLTADDLRLYPVAGVSDAIAVAVGGATCALLSVGGVTCWGRGDFLGVGLTTMDPQPPTMLDLADVAAIDGSVFSTCAIHGADRTVSCWGRDHVASAGGALTIASTPVTVEGLRDIRQASTGQSHACALREGGTVVCWGSNYYGQLGDGTMEDRAEPTLVELP